jgi:hypothetical protein
VILNNRTRCAAGCKSGVPPINDYERIVMGCAIGRLGALVGAKAIAAGRVVVRHAGKYRLAVARVQSIGAGDVEV